MVDFFRRNDQSALSSIPVKANKLLQVILCLMVIIGVKLWHLAVIQHDKRSQEAFRARRKVVVEPAERGTIRDRFGALLATNKVAYRVSLSYNQIREVPAIRFTIDASGNKVKRYARREYIHSLAAALAEVLHLDAGRIEDEIHSNAVFYGHIPYLIKDHISESEYYRLKMMEKDWPGIVCQRYPKRHYPEGKIASHVVGYIGPMPKARYSAIVEEIKRLEVYVKQVEDNLFEDPELPEGVGSYGQAKRRLAELQEMAYTIGDNVGLMGAESAFEEELRGYAGKRIFFSDAKGNFMRPLPGSHPPLPGKRLYLSISSELQRFAEELLAQSEQDRELFTQKKLKTPWMRGGSIVAMLPTTGEVVALASYPRFDPNDYVSSEKYELWWQNPVLRWVEGSRTLGAIWDGLLPVKRERFDVAKGGFYDEERPLTWKLFLEWLLPEGSPLIPLLHEKKTLGSLLTMQDAFSQILSCAPQLTACDVINIIYPTPHMRAVGGGLRQLVQLSDEDRALFLEDVASEKALLDRYLSHIPDNNDKLLALDLSRLIVNGEEVSDTLRPVVESLTIESYRQLLPSYVACVDEVRQIAKEVFRRTDFARFREESEREFLKEKRAQEKLKKQIARPYLEYVDKEEKEQFARFFRVWKPFLVEYAVTKRSSLSLLDRMPLMAYFEALEGAMDTGSLDAALDGLDLSLRVPYLQLFRSYVDLSEPLYGAYGKLTTLQDLAASFSLAYGPGHSSSFAYRNPIAQGSIFKVVTAAAALLQNVREGSDLRLFEMVDRVYKQNGKVYVGQFLDGRGIPQLYKGGRVPKSLSKEIGRIDLQRAIETSSDPYFSLLAGDHLKDPEDLKRLAKEFGYGERSGIRLPHEASGVLPRNVQEDKTGLYAFAIGQGEFTATPVQAACMLSCLASGGDLVVPRVERLLAGRGGYYDKDIVSLEQFPYKEELASVGIDFPLFLATLPQEERPRLYDGGMKVRRQLFLPPEVRQELLSGMRRVILRLQRDDARQFAPLFQKHPGMKRDFLQLSSGFVGKTSTAESKERVTPFVPLEMYNHTWFGGILFDEKQPFVFKDAFGRPELVVVVQLRYGGYGKEGAPLAAQIAEKWRSLQINANQLSEKK